MVRKSTIAGHPDLAAALGLHSPGRRHNLREAGIDLDLVEGPTSHLLDRRSLI
jgi:hypothetical protein